MAYGILQGVRVLELGPYIALPLTGRILAALGAEVIKLETNRVLDLMVFIPPWGRGMGQPEYQALKRRITLDVRMPAGRKVFERLLRISDVFMTNFRRDVLARWGIDFPTIREVKPDIIILWQTSFGGSGPYERYKMYGIMMQHISGISLMSGFPEPALSGCINSAYSDYHTPVFQALGVIAALGRRQRTGKGALIEGSIFRSGACTVGPTLLDYQVNKRLPERMGNRHPTAAPHGVYPCRGKDEWCAIAVFTDKEWEAFCDAIGRPSWTQDSRFSTLIGRMRHVDALDRLICEWTSQCPKEEVMEKMQRAGVPAGIVAKGQDLAEGRHLRERGFYQETPYYIPDPQRPGGEWERGPDVVASRIPIAFSETPCLSGPYHRIGEDNDYVYGELLGMPREEIKRLADEGVFY